VNSWPSSVAPASQSIVKEIVASEAVRNIWGCAVADELCSSHYYHVQVMSSDVPLIPDACLCCGAVKAVLSQGGVEQYQSTIIRLTAT
jgi:hypothetical protein